MEFVSLVADGEEIRENFLRGRPSSSSTSDRGTPLCLMGPPLNSSVPYCGDVREVFDVPHDAERYEYLEDGCTPGRCSLKIKL